MILSLCLTASLALSQVPDEIEPDIWNADNFPGIPQSQAAEICKLDLTAAYSQGTCSFITVQTPDDCCEGTAFVYVSSNCSQLPFDWFVTLVVRCPDGVSSSTTLLGSGSGSTGGGVESFSFSIPCDCDAYIDLEVYDAFGLLDTSTADMGCGSLLCP